MDLINSVSLGGEIAGSEHQEVEWQFEAPAKGRVEPWLEEGSRGEVSVSREEVRRLTDTYLDTGDWRLYRAGYALRVRRRGKGAVVTLKSLAAAGEGGIRERREISEPLESEGPGDDLEALREAAGPVGWRVGALTGRRELQGLFEVRTRRSVYGLSRGGERIGEVALDETEIPVEGGKPAVVGRVEVEAEPGAVGKIEPFVGELREGCGLLPATTSKFETGLRAQGLTPPRPPESEPEEVEAPQRPGEAALAAVRRWSGTFLSCEPGARLGEDPEEARNMLAAGRRLGAALRVFHDDLPPEVRGRQVALEHVTSTLAEVSALDRELEEVRERVAEGPPEDRVSLGELWAVLEGRRYGARERLLGDLDSGRYEELVGSLSALPPGGTVANPGVETAPGVLAELYDELREAGNGVAAAPEETGVEEYEVLRGRGERLLVAVEALSGVYGKPARRLLGSLERLQRLLGEHGEAVAAVSGLWDILDGEESLSRETVFVMGGISYRHGVEAREARARLPEAYARAAGKRWRRLEKVMWKWRPQDEGPG